MNRVKKHTRMQNTQRGAKTGGIITQEAPIHVSNVMVVDAEGKPTRVGYRTGVGGAAGRAYEDQPRPHLPQDR